MRAAIICCAAVAMLAGCAVVPQQAWNFDPTRPLSRPALPVQEATVLTTRLAQLQPERNRIRDQIAAEPDIWKRQALYAQLHRVGMQLSPLERRLGAVAAAR